MLAATGQATKAEETGFRAFIIQNEPPFKFRCFGGASILFHFVTGQGQWTVYSNEVRYPKESTVREPLFEFLPVAVPSSGQQQGILLSTLSTP